jgi:L-threonylcarbamoyladenylate synthase
MDVIRVDAHSPDATVIARAAELLRAGKLVAFPTETVYGLGANALDPAAVERIFAAKGRPSYNPLIVHVANADGARAVAAEWPERADLLAAAFWPGPLTIVVPKRPEVPDSVTAGLGSVAVRVPSHPVAVALIAAAGVPVAAPSANRSMMLSPTSAQHVATSLDGVVDLILDAGATTVGIESTVVDLTTEKPRLLRPGMITATQIERVVGPIVAVTSSTGEDARPSPGMLERHYSPRARLVLVDAAEVADVVRHERAQGANVEALVVASRDHGSPMPRDAADYAACLYERLHALDHAGVDVVVVERVPNTAEWAGIRDRLERAAQR